MDVSGLRPSQGRDSSDGDVQPPQSARTLPDDLPKSLDDRRSFTSYGGETEMYDAWQGVLISTQSRPQVPMVAVAAAGS